MCLHFNLKKSKYFLGGHFDNNRNNVTLTELNCSECDRFISGIRVVKKNYDDSVVGVSVY